MFYRRSEQATQDVDDGVRITAVQCLVGYYSGRFAAPRAGRDL